MYRLTFSKDADKTTRKMPRNKAILIKRKLLELAKDPWSMRNVKQLTDHPGFRLQIGDWRVLYTVNEDEVVIHVIKIKPRGEVYK